MPEGGVFSNTPYMQGPWSRSRLRLRQAWREAHLVRLRTRLLELESSVSFSRLRLALVDD